MNILTVQVMSMLLLAAIARKHHQGSNVRPISFGIMKTNQEKEFEEKKVIGSVFIPSVVNLHNKLRRQECSSNMNEMSYSSELADMAYDWAKQCNFTHGNLQIEGKPNEWIDQMFFSFKGRVVNITKAISACYDEKKNYDYDTNTCKENTYCGHYETVVWAKTKKFGCAIAICPTLAGTNLKNAAFLVCNYSPRGRIIGEHPYLKGPECSQCPAGYTCHLGLCKEPEL